MKYFKSLFMLIALICAGGLFGFFFTMSVAILPGLDQAEPYAALQANQSIGHATQSSLFAMILLGLPLSLLLLLISLFLLKDSRGRIWTLVAILGFCGIIGVTMALNVPLNQSLDGLNLTTRPDQADLLWEEYSKPWQRWNWLRVGFSGLSLVAMGMVFRSQGQKLPR